MIYFVNIKDLTCNFCGVYCFFFSQPVFIQFGWKKNQNLAKIKGYTTTDPVRSELVLTGPRTAVFFNPCINESEGPGPAVQSSSSVLSGPKNRTFKH